MADAKLEIYNANGTLQFNLDNRLLRILTRINSGTSDGSATVAGVNQGDVVGVGVTVPEGGVTPVLTQTGTGVSWSFGGAPTAERKAIDIDIMVY